MSGFWQISESLVRGRCKGPMQWLLSSLVRLCFFRPPPRLYNYLAAFLGVVVAVQTVLKLHKAADFVHSEGQRRSGHQIHSPHDQTADRLWQEFLSAGGQIKGSVAQLTTQKVQLLMQKDVPGASIDHNGSISNPCLTSTDLLKRAYLQPLPEPFSLYGAHRFVMLSGYRTSPEDFVAVGLQYIINGAQGPTFVSHYDRRRRKEGDCFWIGADGTTIDGQLNARYTDEHHGLMYETVVHRCHLDLPTPQRQPGKAIMIIDGERVTITQEGPHPAPNNGTPPYFLSACSFPMYRSLNALCLKEWLQYHHHYIGVDFFVLNDAGAVNAALYTVLEPYMAAGRMEILDMRGEFKFETKHNVLAINNCMHRMATRSQWVLYLDFDEFLFVVPPQTFTALLRAHADAPYLTFGSRWWSVELCRNPGGAYLERMLFHWPQFYCVRKAYRQEKCLNYFGHRKYVVNPRKVEVLQVHRPMEPKHGGIDLETTILYTNHFQGLARVDKPLCNNSLDPSKKPGWWVEDESLKYTWSRIKYTTQPTWRFIRP